MTTAPNTPAPAADRDVVRFATAGAFLEGLAARDFDHVAHTLADDVVLRGLLPAATRELHGVTEVIDQLRRWFGDTDRFEVVDAAVGEVADRLHLRWRIRVQDLFRFGRDWMVVEQQVYATTDERGRLDRLDLLCTGFRTDHRET